MAMWSWKTLMSHLEAPKGQSSQSGWKEEIVWIIKWSDECTISQSGYKRNYLNNKVKWWVYIIQNWYKRYNLNNKDNG